jgi:hypothetical protein
MKIVLIALVSLCSFLFMFELDFVNGISPGNFLVKDAQAIVGRPATPVSGAGVARRTTRRAVTTTAVVATSTAVAVAATAPKTTTVVVASPPPPSTTVVVTSPPTVPIGTIVQVLPAGCTSIVVNGVNYSNCGSVYYKTAFQGNNVIYVVVEKPL